MCFWRKAHTWLQVLSHIWPQHLDSFSLGRTTQHSYRNGKLAGVKLWSTHFTLLTSFAKEQYIHFLCVHTIEEWESCSLVLQHRNSISIYTCVYVSYRYEGSFWHFPPARFMYFSSHLPILSKYFHFSAVCCSYIAIYFLSFSNAFKKSAKLALPAAYTKMLL